MRCSFSSALVGLVGLGGCVTTTTRTFLPSRQNPLYRPAEAEPVLTEYLRLQCPAFRKAQRPDSGIVRFVVRVDSAGFATSAELAQGTGDQLVDGVFGTVAAQLTFAPDTLTRRPRREAVSMHYACVGESARVSVR